MFIPCLSEGRRTELAKRFNLEKAVSADFTDFHRIKPRT
jgi:hypothetical protein